MAVAEYWTAEEDEKLKYLRNITKLRFIEIFERLPGRSRKACQNRYQYLNGVRRYRTRVKVKRLPTFNRVYSKTVGAIAFKANEAALMARDARANEPRDLTSILMGDPPASQSALGQAQGASRPPHPPTPSGREAPTI